MSDEFKEGDEITLSTGSKFLLPWTPVKSNGKIGAGKKWIREDGTKIPKSDWEELFNHLIGYSGVERDEVCDIYDSVFQTLQKKFTGNPAMKASLKSKPEPEDYKNVSLLERKLQIEYEISIHDEAIELLRVELKSLRDERKDEFESLKKHLEELEKL